MYCLDLSIIYKVHFVFHVFLLKLYNCKLNDDFILDYFILKNQQRDLSVRDVDYKSSASYVYQKS